MVYRHLFFLSAQHLILLGFCFSSFGQNVIPQINVTEKKSIEFKTVNSIHVQPIHAVLS